MSTTDSWPTGFHRSDREINAAAPGTDSAGRPLFATQGRNIGASMWDGFTVRAAAGVLIAAF